MAAADGSISPEESTLILESIDINNLSEPGKRQLNSYIVKAPSLEDCLKKLSKADELLKWSLIFYLLQIAWVDNSLDVGEEQAIKLTQTTFKIKDTQLQAMQEFIQILKSISENKIAGKQSIEIINNATSVLVAEGIPLLGLFTSGNANNFTASKNYSEDKFWDKLKKFAITAGKEVVEKVLLLYYTLQQPNVPVKVKAIITGALGYFIMPFDLAPDFIPGVGLGDDITALVAALATVAMYITPEVKEAVKQKMQELFGNT